MVSPYLFGQPQRAERAVAASLGGAIGSVAIVLRSIGSRAIGSLAILLLGGKLPAVIQLSTKALALNEDDVDSHFRLAVALHMTGKLTKAIAHYRSTLVLSPDKVDAHLNLGKVLHTEGNLPEAMKHYREALRISSNNPTARQQLSLAQQQLGL